MMFLKFFPRVFTTAGHCYKHSINWKYVRCVGVSLYAGWSGTRSNRQVLRSTKAYKRHFGTVKHALHTPPTIFSLSSGHGKCGVAVVRVSGSKVKDIISVMIPDKISMVPRRAVLSTILDPRNKLPIDKGLILYFPGPNSFTGEDCLEFQVHGGPAVLSSLLSALHKIPDCRQAEPGEFTKRAFMNGKLDLTEAEGLGDLIHAETEVQRKQALRQMDGDLSKLYAQWRKTIIKCVADLEAFIDFSEDQHIEEEVINRVNNMVHSLKKEISQHVNDKRQGERLREGVHVTILGEPNVGKSSLLNTICQRPAAIVTEIAGTTRDIIETPVNIDGYPVLLSDTAGLRETQDIVEKEGVLRAVNRANKSDIRIFMFDCTECLSGNNFKSSDVGFRNHISTILNNFNQFHKFSDKQCINVSDKKPNEKFPTGEIFYDNEDINIDFSNTIILLNKIDLLPSNMWQSFKTEFQIIDTKYKDDFDANTLHRDSRDRGNHLGEIKTYSNYNSESASDRNMNSKTNTDLEERCTTGVDSVTNSTKDEGLSICYVSCKTDEGFDNFISVLRDKVAYMCGNPLAGHPSLTQTRHRSHLVKCLENLDHYDNMMAADDIVLASECLRRALREIGKITGNISSEEILDVIFKDFCIGK